MDGSVQPPAVARQIWGRGRSCDVATRASCWESVEPFAWRTFEVPALHIYIDADACPVKQEAYRVARRYDLRVTLVAGSWMWTPNEPNLSLEVVDQGFDAADDWIAARAGRNDIVITADIPLAARCLERGAYILGPTGRPFTESNIGDAMATRNLLSEMRGAGLDSGGPPPFDARDRSRFVGALDQAIQTLRRAKERGDE